MKFQDYQYERINIDELRNEVNLYIDKLKNAQGYTEFLTAFKEVYRVFSHVDSMATLSQVRYTINTEDEFYSKENDFWDEYSPFVQQLQTDVSKVVLGSSYKEELKKDVPETYFLLSEFALKSFDEKIMNDLQEENKLVSEYEKLIASAKIEFDGETYTLASLGAKMEDKDELVRKGAYKAYWGYMEEHETDIDAVYDKLVKVRDRIAKKLGFNNFVELGYIRMNRMDYNEEDVSNYRKQVLEDVVPVASKLYNAQMKRIGVDKLEVFNNNFEFVSGNPTPKHTKDEMVKIAQNMYHELSKETGEFFDFMIEHDLLDLEAKPGKMGGGYCTYMSDFNSPFIFSNFNGTSGDVDVLTHEAGHAFQVFSSQGIEPANCMWPTLESAEIHSMSMEFFAWPWMKNFFEEDTDKYYYTHLGDAVKFLPYGVLVDHFQHEVYNNVDMTPEERKETWRRLEKQYLPHKNYDAIPILEKGTWWFRQQHIFSNPFYYIDYTLAQVCAFQFWLRLQENDSTAFHDYYEICKAGGTISFGKIVAKANLKSPFQDGCLKDVMKSIDVYLSSYDDSKF